MSLSVVRSPSDARPAGHPRRRRTAGPAALAVAFTLALVAILLGRFALAGPSRAPRPAGQGLSSGPGSGSAAAVDRAKQLLRAHPGNPAALTDLGIGYLSRARETGDPSYYSLAERALRRSSTALPDDLNNLVGLGLLDLSRHQFRSALARGSRAVARYPDSAEALGVVVDAQVELGRYGAAVVSAQAMADRRPNLASLSRISYLRELHGDPGGAISVLTEGLTAGSGSPGDLAYVNVLLGDLLRGQGRLGEAAGAYRTAAAEVPSYPQAAVGLARLDIANGDLRSALRRLGTAVVSLPLPETAALYGDVLAGVGRPAESARQYELVRSIEVLQRANGVVVDLESARFETDHARGPGARPGVAVGLARRALANRPTIYGHDTLAWALRQAGSAKAALPEADAALALGTRDAMLYYHRAAIEADLGLNRPARRDLTTAFSISPDLMSASSLSSIRDLAAARTLASRLHVREP